MDATSNNRRFWLTIALPVLGSLALLALVATRSWHPSPFRGAAEVVASLYAPGDLVILHPQSRFAELELLDPAIDAIAATTLPSEVDRFERVILVRTRDDMVPPIRRTIAARAALLYAQDVEDLTIELFQLNAPEHVELDLATALPTATVTMEPSDEPAVPCPWAGGRFDCPDADWTWVGPTTQVFEGEPHGCIWMHPIEDADLVVEFPHVAGTHVTGWYGLTDYAISIPDGGPVRLSLEAGDEIGRFRAHRQGGRRPLRFALPEGYEGPLRMTVSAARPGVRHLCWDLQVVTSASP